MSEPTTAVPTVREIINAFLEDCELRRRVGQLGDKLLLRMQRLLGKFAARFGERPAASIKPQDVMTFFAEHPKWKAGYTMQDVARTVRSAFTWASDEDLIPKDPLRRLR